MQCNPLSNPPPEPDMQELLGACDTIFCSEWLSPGIRDAMNRFHIPGGRPLVLFLGDSTRHPGNATGGVPFVTMDLPAPPAPPDAPALPATLALPQFTAVPLSVPGLNSLRWLKAGRTIIVVDDDCDSSPVLLAVMLRLYCNDTFKTLSVLVVSRRDGGGLPSTQMQCRILSGLNSIPHAALVACGRLGTRRDAVPTLASQFSGYVRGLHEGEPRVNVQVAWCDAVCDCSCSAAVRPVEDADAWTLATQTGHYYARSTEDDAVQSWAQFNGCMLEPCDKTEYAELRVRHKIGHVHCRSSLACSPATEAVAAHAAAATARPAIIGSSMRLDLFRSGLSPDATARALIQCGGHAGNAAELVTNYAVCDTVLRACHLKHARALAATRQADSVSCVVPLFAAMHAAYLESCSTVFCCGSSVVPIADSMRRHLPQLTRQSGHDPPLRLPSLVLLYNGDPPQMLLPAANPLVQFEWNGGDGQPALPVLGVVMSCDSGRALRSFHNVQTLLVAADASCSSAPTLRHALFNLWMLNRERILTVRVVARAGLPADKPAARWLHDAVHAQPTAPNYGMAVGWSIPDKNAWTGSQHKTMEEFREYLNGGRVVWEERLEIVTGQARRRGESVTGRMPAASCIPVAAAAAAGASVRALDPATRALQTCIDDSVRYMSCALLCMTDNLTQVPRHGAAPVRVPATRVQEVSGMRPVAYAAAAVASDRPPDPALQALQSRIDDSLRYMSCLIPWLMGNLVRRAARESSLRRARPQDLVTGDPARLCKRSRTDYENE